MINSLKFLPKDFTYFEDPFYIYFTLICFSKIQAAVLQAIFKFFNVAFYNINFWFKISKICPKISHFSQISHSRGSTASIVSVSIVNRFGVREVGVGGGGAWGQKSRDQGVDDVSNYFDPHYPDSNFPNPNPPDPNSPNPLTLTPLIPISLANPNPPDPNPLTYPVPTRPSTQTPPTPLTPTP